MTPKKAKSASGGLHQNSRQQQPSSKAAPGSAKCASMFLRTKCWQEFEQPSSQQSTPRRVVSSSSPATSASSLLSSSPAVASLPSALCSPTEQHYHRQRRPPLPENGITMAPFSQQQGTYNIYNASTRLFHPQHLDPQQKQQHQPSRFSYPLGFDLEPTPIREPARMHQRLVSSSSWPLLLHNASLSLQESPTSSQERRHLLGGRITNELQLPQLPARSFHDQQPLSHGHGQQQQDGGLLTGSSTNDSSLAFSSLSIPGDSGGFAAFQQLRDEEEGLLQQRHVYEQFQEEERYNKYQHQPPSSARAYK
jgi:hypothetical protein